MSQNTFDEYRLLAEYYDHVIPYRNRKDIDFYLEMAQKLKGQVLELGCGTGRILLTIAKAGINIVGIDRSDKMLSICQKKLLNEPESTRNCAEISKEEMRNFDLKRKFDLVIIPFRAFQHLLTIEDQISCLKCIRNHLNDNGKLIFDLFNPSLQRLVDDKYLGEAEEEPEFKMPDGRKVIRCNKTINRDLENQILNIQFIFYITYPDGRTERFTENTKLRYFFRYEVENLLARCGFKVDEVYGDLNKTPFGADANQELIFVAREI